MRARKKNGQEALKVKCRKVEIVECKILARLKEQNTQSNYEVNDRKLCLYWAQEKVSNCVLFSFVCNAEEASLIIFETTSFLLFARGYLKFD